MSLTKIAAMAAAGLMLAANLSANQTDKEDEDKLVIKANKIKKIEFSGTHYFGYKSISPVKSTDTSAASAGFESRRNYVQMKSYFTDKDYFRITMDARKELRSTTVGNDGYNSIYVKYAYLYLNEILPYTGVEVGIAHRPWIDYEEHNSWYWRSINKVVIEDKHEVLSVKKPDLVNSSDFGFNLKTKLPYFSSEIGLFNGEGYHADKAAANQRNSTDLSFEGRLTYHVLGNGQEKAKPKKHTYLNISTAWLSSNNHKDNNITVEDPKEYDRVWNSFHIVYNQPEFLVAAQYITSKDSFDDSSSDVEGKVMSVNADVRLGDYTLIGRYDVSTWDVDGKEDKSKGGTCVIAGVAYDYMPGVKLIANIKNYKNDESGDAGKENSYNSFLLTTAIHW